MNSCLITEHADNIDSLFEPGKEILTYRTKEDLVEAVMQARDDVYRTSVAAAGQARTLRDHTIENFYETVQPALGL